MAFIVKRLDQDYPLDKTALFKFAILVGLNHRQFRAPNPTHSDWWFNIMALVSKYDYLKKIDVNELTDDEWGFICGLPVEEN
jgi:hypothetical protein